MESVFFQATADALDSVTSLYDFIHPLTASLLYTRKTIEDANTRNPSFSSKDLKELIDPDDNVHGISNPSIFLNTPWNDLEQRLAWILLNNLFAIHEGWAYRLYSEHFHNYGYNDRTFEKNLEFTGLSGKFTSYFATSNKRSSVMTDSFFDVYKDKSALDFGKLENYMKMYRFFKEIRNCSMHKNQITSQNVIDSYNDYLPVATLADLDTSEVPVVFPPVLGQPLTLSLRGVIGFSQFLRRILIISDINLIKAKASEDEFLSKKPETRLLKDGTPQKPPIKTLSTIQTNAIRQARQYSRKIGLLMPRWTEEYQDFLIDHHIFNFSK